MLAKTYSSTLQGIQGELIQVEAARQRATPKIQITGLPNEVVKESKERIRVCLNGLGYEVPTSQLVVHLSPASQKKQGSQFDLAIAMTILAAENLINPEWIRKSAFLGELRLDGKVEGVSGAIALIESLEANPRIQNIFLSKVNEKDASLLDSKKVKLVSHVGELLEYFKTQKPLSTPDPFLETVSNESSPLFNKIVGQSVGKRVLEIALAGFHHLLLIGPPGVGKSMLAHAAEGLLPPLETQELTEVLKVYQASGRALENSRERPFRSPHHSISRSGLLGGGSGFVVPGEVSLAHYGILFLDEFPEFQRDSIEGLREPLENGQIQLHRVGCFHTLPSQFLLMAALNPCPCGYSLGGKNRCFCPWEKISNYRRKISGPILDRFDLGVLLLPEASVKISHFAQSEENKSEILREKINKVWSLHKKRVGLPPSFKTLDPHLHKEYFTLSTEVENWLNLLIQKESISMRRITKLLRVARTIADLAEEENIQLRHLSEAWQFRCPDLHTLTKF